MADTLRRLVGSETCKLLQAKLDDWYKHYHINSCDENLSQCCELIELNSKVQGQLFSILSLTARQGGHYGGIDTIKSRFLPWLGTCFSISSPDVSPDTSFSLLQESMEKEKRLRDLTSTQDKEIQMIEAQLTSTRLELDGVKQDLRASKELAAINERKLDVLSDHERQIRLLKDEVSLLSTEKSLLQNRDPRCKKMQKKVEQNLEKEDSFIRLSRSRSPSPLPLTSKSPRASRSPSPLPSLRSESPTSARHSNASRHARLVSRFNDVYANDRLDAQNLLRRYIDKLEMVQRIIFIATTESFHAAKLAFRQFKLRVRKTLSPCHKGPELLEDAVIDYIVRNLDLYDVQTSVNDVICAMNVHPKISFPPEVDFILISSFIREMCRIAFAMQALDPPLDIAFTSDGELYSESKYRRSFDSEYTAPLVVYHVWPALMENDCVIMKGEVLTKRGALWSPGRSKSRCSSPIRSRSASPSRSLSCRSRSPSPVRRSGTPSEKTPYKSVCKDTNISSVICYNQLCDPGRKIPHISESKDSNTSSLSCYNQLCDSGRKTPYRSRSKDTSTSSVICYNQLCDPGQL